MSRGRRTPLLKHVPLSQGNLIELPHKDLKRQRVVHIGERLAAQPHEGLPVGHLAPEPQPIQRPKGGAHQQVALGRPRLQTVGEDGVNAEELGVRPRVEQALAELGTQRTCHIWAEGSQSGGGHPSSDAGGGAGLPMRGGESADARGEVPPADARSGVETSRMGRGARFFCSAKSSAPSPSPWGCSRSHNSVSSCCCSSASTTRRSPHVISSVVPRERSAPSASAAGARLGKLSWQCRMKSLSEARRKGSESIWTRSPVTLTANAW